MTDWKKPSWDEYYMNLAKDASTRSPDPSTKHGCFIVDQDYHMISFGYNGPPSGMKNSEVPLTRPEKYPYMLHAEHNAVLFADRSLKDAIVYITGFPCSSCMCMLIQKRVGQIIYGDVTSKCSDETDQAIVRHMHRICGYTLCLRHYSEPEK